MAKIARVRPVLLSAPYASDDNLEVQVHLPSGYRTTGLVELTLDDGTIGLGEAYVAVFAPQVFVAIVDVLKGSILNQDADIPARYRDMCRMCDYWSLQGPARHVIGAVEMALVDANAKQCGAPAYQYLVEHRAAKPLQLYGSGGDSDTPNGMDRELDLLEGHGIKIFKIRARKHEVDKAVWALEQAAARGIALAIDMTQNLADPAQSVNEVEVFLSKIRARSPHMIHFIEEALGPLDIENYPRLRAKTPCPVAGGEIVTTAHEFSRRVAMGCYDLAQPDATVVGGIHETLVVFSACHEKQVEAVVHCWGSGVGMMANYHAALAGGGKLAEWPMPAYALRSELLCEPLGIVEGLLHPPLAPGLGVELTPELESRYPFREDATYRCLTPPRDMAQNPWQTGG